jgi:hypothetical protein
MAPKINDHTEALTDRKDHTDLNANFFYAIVKMYFSVRSLPTVKNVFRRYITFGPSKKTIR